MEAPCQKHRLVSGGSARRGGECRRGCRVCRGNHDNGRQVVQENGADMENAWAERGWLTYLFAFMV